MTPAKAKKRPILVVGGASFVRKLRKNPATRDFTVSGVSTSGDALAKLARGSCDVILVDVSEKTKSRYALCRKIKKQFPFVPLVIVGQSLEDVTRAERECPVGNDYLGEQRISAPILERAIREAKITRSLAEEQDFNAVVFDSMGALVVVSEPDGAFLRANKAFLATMGLKASDVIGKKAENRTASKEDARREKDTISALKKGKKTVQQAVTYRAKDGTSRLVGWSSAGIYDDEGKLKYVVCTGRDLTKQAKVETALHESEDRFHRAFQASPGLFAITRPSDGLHYEVNEKWLEILGYKPSEVIGKTAAEIGVWANEGDRKRMMSVLKKDGAVRNFEGQMKTKSGEVRNHLISAEIVHMEGEDRLLWMAQDITDLKVAEGRIHRHLDREELLGKVSMAFLQRDADHAIRYTLSEMGAFLNVDEMAFHRRDDLDGEDGTFPTYLRWTPKTSLKSGGRVLSAANHPHALSLLKKGKLFVVGLDGPLSAAAKKDRATMKTLGIHSKIMVPIMHGKALMGSLCLNMMSGKRKWSEEEIRFIESMAETMALGIHAGGVEDALKSTLSRLEETVEKRTRSLRASEARLRDMMDAASDWRWECDKDFIFTYFSESAARIMGLDPSVLIGKRRHDIVETMTGEDKEKWEAHLIELENHLPFRDFEYDFRRVDNVLKRFRISGKPVFDEDKKFTGYRGTGSDITDQVEAERRAAEAQSRLLEAIEAMDSGFLLLDKERKLVLCNTRYREQSDIFAHLLKPGILLEDIVRASVKFGAVDIGDASLDEWVTARLEAPPGGKRTTEQHHMDDRWFLVNDYTTAEGGRLIVRTEITDRKRAELALRASEERRRIVLDTVVDAILTIDEKGLLQTLNPAAEDVFGYTTEEVRGQNVSMLMPEPYRSAHDEYLESYLTTGKARIIGIGREVEGLRKDGSTFPMDLAVGETEIDGEKMFVGIVRDITARRETENAFRQARMEAEASNRSKSQFLANMSHELRTPLNAIIGFSEIMKTEIFGEISNPQYKEYISNIEESGRHLLTLINDILDLSKIEAGALELFKEPVKIDTLINESLVFIRSHALERNIHIGASISSEMPSFYLDPQRVKQILLNLLSNAVKFGKDEGRIDIRASVNEGGHLLIEVEDDGIGMAPDEITLALSEFGQVQSVREHTRTQEGTGLGLPLSQNLAALHGGSLEIDSKKGRGTKVLLRFPPKRPA